MIKRIETLSLRFYERIYHYAKTKPIKHGGKANYILNVILIFLFVYKVAIIHESFKLFGVVTGLLLSTILIIYFPQNDLLSSKNLFIFFEGLILVTLMSIPHIIRCYVVTITNYGVRLLFYIGIKYVFHLDFENEVYKPFLDKMLFICLIGLNLRHMLISIIYFIHFKRNSCKLSFIWTNLHFKQIIFSLLNRILNLFVLFSMMCLSLVVCEHFYLKFFGYCIPRSIRFDICNLGIFEIVYYFLKYCKLNSLNRIVSILFRYYKFNLFSTFKDLDHYIDFTSFYYFLHRLMHTPLCYSFFHSLHHISRIPLTTDSNSEGNCEVLLIHGIFQPPPSCISSIIINLISFDLFIIDEHSYLRICEPTKLVKSVDEFNAFIPDPHLVHHFYFDCNFSQINIISKVNFDVEYKTYCDFSIPSFYKDNAFGPCSKKVGYAICVIYYVAFPVVFLISAYCDNSLAILFLMTILSFELDFSRIVYGIPNKVSRENNRTILSNNVVLKHGSLI